MSSATITTIVTRLESLPEALQKKVAERILVAATQQAKALLSLQNFALGKLSFRLKALDVQKGQLVLHAIAHIEQFPGA